jgi:hypothetical protein
MKADWLSTDKTIGNAKTTVSQSSILANLNPVKNISTTARKTFAVMPTPTFSSTNVDDTTIDHHCGHHRHMNTGLFQRKVSSLDGGGHNSWTIFCTCYYSHSLA